MTRASDTARILSGGVVINEDSNDVDFRVESNGNANMLVVDGGDDAVVIGHNASRTTLFNTTATAALQIEGTSGNTASMSIVRNSNDDNGPQLVLGKSNGTTNGAVTVVTDDALLGRISFQGADGTQTVEAGRIECLVDGTPGADDMPGRLVFSTTADGASSPTERMIIEDDGRAIFNTTQAFGTGVLNVKLAGTNKAVGIRLRAETAGNWMIAFENSSGTVIGQIVGNASSTSYNTSSDHRLKENVEDMTGAINRVKQLLPKRFNFIADDTNTLVDGFLAHETQSVVAEAVTGTHNEVDDDGNAVMQGIDQAKLVPLLTGALKEAIAKIETLETENATQATQIADLISRVTALENA